MKILIAIEHTIKHYLLSHWVLALRLFYYRYLKDADVVRSLRGPHFERCVLHFARNC